MELRSRKILLAEMYTKKKTEEVTNGYICGASINQKIKEAKILPYLLRIHLQNI